MFTTKLSQHRENFIKLSYPICCINLCIPECAVTCLSVNMLVLQGSHPTVNFTFIFITQRFRFGFHNDLLYQYELIALVKTGIVTSRRILVLSVSLYSKLLLVNSSLLSPSQSEYFSIQMGLKTGKKQEVVCYIINQYMVTYIPKRR